MEIMQAWYVALVMEDLCCLPVEYQFLEENASFSMFFHAPNKSHSII